MFFRTESVQLGGKCAVWLLEIKTLTNILDMQSVSQFPVTMIKYLRNKIKEERFVWAHSVTASSHW